MNRRSPAWISAFVAIVFGGGVATGVLLHDQLRPSPSANVTAFEPSLPPPIFMRLSEELALTGAQQQQLREILAARRHKIDALRADVRKRFEADAEDLFADIHQILTPEQRKQFEMFATRVRSRIADQNPPFPPLRF